MNYCLITSSRRIYYEARDYSVLCLSKCSHYYTRQESTPGKIFDIFRPIHSVTYTGYGPHVGFFIQRSMWESAIFFPFFFFYFVFALFVSNVTYDHGNYVIVLHSVPAILCLPNGFFVRQNIVICQTSISNLVDVQPL